MARPTRNRFWGGTPFGILLVVLGAGFLLWGGITTYYNSELADHHVVGKGTLSNCQDIDGKDSNTTCTLTYIVDGTLYHLNAPYPPDSVHGGEKVTVYYQSGDPSNALDTFDYAGAVSGDIVVLNLGGLLLVGGAGFILAGFTSLPGRRKPSQ